MKKLIIAGILLTFIGVGFVGCQKQETRKPKCDREEVRKPNCDKEKPNDNETR